MSGRDAIHCVRRTSARPVGPSARPVGPSARPVGPARNVPASPSARGVQQRFIPNEKSKPNGKSEHGRIALLRDHGYLGSVPINLSQSIITQHSTWNSDRFDKNGPSSNTFPHHNLINGSTGQNVRFHCGTRHFQSCSRKQSHGHAVRPLHLTYIPFHKNHVNPVNPVKKRLITFPHNGKPLTPTDGHGSLRPLRLCVSVSLCENKRSNCRFKV